MLAATLRGARRAAQWGARRAMAEARRLRGHVVAPRDAGEAVAREQQDVQPRGREPDHGLDAAAGGEL